MDLLFCSHHSTNKEESTPACGDLGFHTGDNQGTAADQGWFGRDKRLNSDRHQRESSAVAAKRTISSSTTRSVNTTKKTGRTHHIKWVDFGDSESESDVAPDRGLDFGNGPIPAPWIPPLHHLLVSKLLSRRLTWALVF